MTFMTYMTQILRPAAKVGGDADPWGAIGRADNSGGEQSFESAR
jgi:hypothetical protein